MMEAVAARKRKKNGQDYSDAWYENVRIALDEIPFEFEEATPHHRPSGNGCWPCRRKGEVAALSRSIAATSDLSPTPTSLAGCSTATGTRGQWLISALTLKSKSTSAQLLKRTTWPEIAAVEARCLPPDSKSSCRCFWAPGSASCSDASLKTSTLMPAPCRLFVMTRRDSESRTATPSAPFLSLHGSERR